MQDGAGFRDQQRSWLRLIVLLVVGSMDREVNSHGLIGYFVYEARVNLLYFPQVLSHDLRSLKRSIAPIVCINAYSIGRLLVFE